MSSLMKHLIEFVVQKYDNILSYILAARPTFYNHKILYNYKIIRTIIHLLYKHTNRFFTNFIVKV